ncbi:FHA domain-containing protein [Sorangium sp. So ce1024]|uniref:FHA domain-containing protein n=1 Tax=Sorangium sp. So ce1024 TaxID=3133327 RepID=UPI003F0FE565
MTRPSLRGPLGSVICDVCGRDNAGDLTFCQDCGRRLKAREARVAPPTPPTGLPQVSLPDLSAPAQTEEPPANDARAAGRAPGARSAPGRLRPEAPVFSFSPIGSARTEPAMQAVHGRAEVSSRPARDRDGAGALGSAIQMAPALRDARVVADRGNAPPPPATPSITGALLGSPCASCDAANPPGYRFCVTCGAPLNARRDGAAPAGTPPSTDPAPAKAKGSEPYGALSPGAPYVAHPPAAQPGTTARGLQDTAPQHVPPQGAAPQHAPPQAAAPREAPAQGAAPRDDRSGGADAQPQGAGGAPAGKPTPPALPPVAQPPARLPPSATGGGAPDKIVGSPVVDIASSRQVPAPPVVCARCHGQCLAGTRFCKYCGAPLDAERAASERPGRAPPAPTSAPEVGREPPKPPQGDAAMAGSTETGSTPPPSQIPLAPLRASYSVRPPAWVPADIRPTRAPDGKLIVIVEDGTEGKSFQLAGPQIDIGRSEGDILLEDDLYVSPRHARIIPQNGSWVLRDLGSVNRIYLRIRKTHALRDGDLLLLGLEVLQFQTVNDGERGLGHAIQHGTLLFGSPAIHRRARLCQKTVEGVTRDVYHLYRDETVIGRETGDIVFTADPFLSRRHAAIRRNPATGEFTLTDLESSNGTYVAIREDVTLSDRDFVRIGQHLFRVDLSR